MMPQLPGQMWGLCIWQSERRLGASCVFTDQLMKRFEKYLWVKAKIYKLFFSVHELDQLSNISMKRTIEQLAQNSGERKELLKELK